MARFTRCSVVYGAPEQVKTSSKFFSGPSVRFSMPASAKNHHSKMLLNVFPCSVEPYKKLYVVNLATRGSHQVESDWVEFKSRVHFLLVVVSE